MCTPTLLARVNRTVRAILMPRVLPGHHAFQCGAVLDAVQGSTLRSAPAFRRAFGP